MHRERQKESIYEINFKPIVKSQIMNTAISKDIGQLRWSHTMRVTKLAMKLAEYMTESVNNIRIDPRKVRIMCVLHDMYKYVEHDKDSHGPSVAKYLSSILDAFEMNDTELTEWTHVLNALHDHSLKNIEELKSSNPYLALLQDADVLDKLSLGWIWYTNKLFCGDELVEVTAEYYKSKVDKYTGATPGYKYLYDKAVEALESPTWNIPLSRKHSKKYGVIKKGK